MFRGFFHGLANDNLGINDKQQARLHSVLITEGASAIGKTLGEIAIDDLVSIKSIKRRNIRGLEPDNSLHIAAGDVLVLLGLPEELAAAEFKLLQG